MITCNRCGKLVPAGMANCQNCGEPVLMSSTMGSGGNPKAVAPKQPELPAWLETLRAGDRSPPPPAPQPNFSVADLIEEGAFPSWIRPENGEFDMSLSGPHPAWRPSAVPAPDTDGLFPPGRGIAANSLIDEQALPSWMRGQSESSPQDPTNRNIPASSLVQPDALPEWMRIMQQQQQQQPQQPQELQQSGQLGQQWQQSASSPSLQQPAFPGAPIPPGLKSPVQWSEPVMPLQAPQRLAGGDLIDQQSLPAWMTNQNASQGPMEVPPGSRQAGLPGSSLFDVNALPQWLREQGQEQMSAGNNGMAVGMPPTAQPPSPASGQMPGMQGGNLAAGSLIDVDALPEWLRSTVNQQQAGMPSPRQAVFGPPRAENINVRVPSRPRGELGPREQSEAAANIFASVLGVASSAPSLSGQVEPPENFQGQPGMQGLPGQGSQAGPPPSLYAPQSMMPQAGQYPPQQVTQQMGSGMPGIQPGYVGPSQSLQAPQAPQAPQTSGYPGYPPGGYQGGYPGGYPMSGQPGTLQQPQQFQQSSMYPPAMSPGSAMAGQTKQNAKRVKRSFLDHIRDWFSR